MPHSGIVVQTAAFVLGAMIDNTVVKGIQLPDRSDALDTADKFLRENKTDLPSDCLAIVIHLPSLLKKI